MFIFNVKVNKNLFSKIAFILMLVIIAGIFSVGVYSIFFKENRSFKVTDSIKQDDVFEVTSENYANILKASCENIDSYVGTKVHITGYVYRLIDFKENQFVIARDMVISDDMQSLIVGFLCEYEKATDFSDGEWVEITGEIKKGNFNGDIAILNILTINKAGKPENPYVSMPSDTYIPTANMF